MSDLPFAEHDHAHCASGVLTHADRLADEKGLRLTPVRRATLEILLSGHRAMGAYEVLDHLKNGVLATNHRSRIGPWTF